MTTSKGTEGGILGPCEERLRPRTEKKPSQGNSPSLLHFPNAHTHLHTHTHTYPYTHTYIHTPTPPYTYIPIYIHIHPHTHKSPYTCTSIYTPMHTLPTHTHTHRALWGGPALSTHSVIHTHLTKLQALFLAAALWTPSGQPLYLLLSDLGMLLRGRWEGSTHKRGWENVRGGPLGVAVGQECSAIHRDILTGRSRDPGRAPQLFHPHLHAFPPPPAPGLWACRSVSDGPVWKVMGPCPPRGLQGPKSPLTNLAPPQPRGIHFSPHL